MHGIEKNRESYYDRKQVLNSDPFSYLKNRENNSFFEITVLITMNPIYILKIEQTHKQISSIVDCLSLIPCFSVYVCNNRKKGIP